MPFANVLSVIETFNGKNADDVMDLIDGCTYKNCRSQLVYIIGTIYASSERCETFFNENVFCNAFKFITNDFRKDYMTFVLRKLMKGYRLSNDFVLFLKNNIVEYKSKFDFTLLKSHFADIPSFIKAHKLMYFEILFFVTLTSKQCKHQKPFTLYHVNDDYIITCYECTQKIIPFPFTCIKISDPLFRTYKRVLL